MQRSQTGFTLIEIAIVLVIIGLLLGGVLKGQEMVNSAKVKNLAGDLRAIPLFIYGYQDKFKALPGDDISATTHLPGSTKASLTTHTPGNGTIEGTWNEDDIANENVLFWQHIRLAGLANGSTDFTSSAKAGLPTNAEGGRVGIQMGTPPITNLSGTYFACSGGINGKLAQQLDTTIDDGSADGGSLRAVVTGGTTAATAFDSNKLYTVCLGF